MEKYGTGIRNLGRFNTYFLNNNRIYPSKREYILEVEGISESFPGAKDHNKWTMFLEDNPHIISNFDTTDPVKLAYLYKRWQIYKNNG